MPAITDRGQLALVEESQYGSTPTTPAFKLMRFTGETLKQDTSTVDSQEIRADRQVGDHRRVNVGVSGDINVEMSYGSHDDLLEAALMSSNWTTAAAVIDAEITISFESKATSSTSYAKILDSANGLAGFARGEWLIVSGAATAGNNVVCKVVSAVAGELEVIVASEANDLIDEAAGSSVTLTRAATITNGVDERFFTFERKYTDLSNKFIRFVGVEVNRFQLQMQLEERITASFGMMGSKAIPAEAAIAGATYAATNSNEIFTVTDNITGIFEDNTPIELTQLSLELNNELRSRNVLGKLGAQSLGAGKCRVSGSFEMFLDDLGMMTKYVNFTSTSLIIYLHDTAGNKYVIDIPKVQLSDGSAPVQGESSDVMQPFNFTAILHGDDGYTIRIARIPAA